VLDSELAAVLPTVRAIVALGSYAWQAALTSLAVTGVAVPRPRPQFGHGVEVMLRGPVTSLTLLGSYHPSQQNTFTGRLTAAMLDDVMSRASACARRTAP